MANRRKDRNLIIYFVYIFVISSAFLFYVWQHTQTVKLGYKINRLQVELQELKNKNNKLKVELNSLKSLSRIEKIAKEELKMVKPPAKDVIILRGE